MPRSELIAGLAMILALVVAQSPAWALNYAYNGDGAGVTYLAQNFHPSSEIPILQGKNDDPPPHKRADDPPPPKRGDDPPPHG
jgi:hypothetical protein